MKKTFKRILTFTLAAILAVGTFSFTSCNGGKTTAIKIGIPDDATNQARAIKLLETAGLIEVDPAAGATPEMRDITKYIYNIEICPTAANTLPSLLGDYGACTINGTFATSAGLLPSRDALITEDQGDEGIKESINIIAARTAEKDSETYKTIVDAFHTEEVAVYMLEKYTETYFPAFKYEKTMTETPAEFVAAIDAYKSSKDGKTVVTVGVCGPKNDFWKAVQKVLDDRNANIYIELKEFSSYNLPNEALANGEIDLNSFQHYAYLNKECAENNFDLTAVGESLFAPLSLYSQKYESLDALKTAAGLAE